MYLHRTEDDDKLLISPFFKDPGLARRLSKHSAHAWSVHSSWPATMLKRLEKLTTCSDALPVYRAELLRRFSVDNCIVPRQQLHGMFSGKRKPRHGKVFWFPISFHPWWQRILSKAIARFNKDRAMSSLLAMATNSKWFNSCV